MNASFRWGYLAMAKPQILVVDDDLTILEMLSMHLQFNGYGVMTATDGEQAIITIEREKPDLVLLDIMMPSVDGLTVCEQVREYSPVPIIIVSALGHEDQKVKALDLGADDYLTKPFGIRELLARVRVALRRAETGSLAHSDVIFQAGNFKIDFLRRLVTIDDETVHLTPIEYGLLRELAKNQDSVITHDQLLQRVWGNEYRDSVPYLHVYVGRLRIKLSAVEGAKIVTKSGVGYMLKTQI